MIAGQLAALTAAARPAAAPPPSYTGPLDLTATPAVVAYGQRALSAAKLGTAVYTIREDSGDTTQSFSSDATTGAVDAAAITAFLNGANGFVTNWDDQSGNGSDVLQATAASQPGWVASASNSRPGLSFDGTDDYLSTAGNVSMSSSAYTVFAVTKSTLDDPSGAAGAILALNGSDIQDENGPDWTVYQEIDNSGNAGAGCYGDDLNFNNGNGGNAQPITLNTYNLLVFAFDASGTSIYLNGVSQSITTDFKYGDGSVGALDFILTLGARDTDASAIFSGQILEAFAFNQLFAGETITAISQNIATYYGITLS